MDLGVVVTKRDDWQVVTVSGEVDIATAPSLRERLLSLVTDGNHQLVVDLDDVGFLDSTGLGVLVGALKRARTQGGDLRLVCSQSRILKVFQITRLDAAFGIYPSADIAVQADRS